MSLVTVGSVKGAPGVTTLSLLVATELGRRIESRRPRVVLVECDTSGGDLAPRLGLPGLPGIATLALAARRGLSTDLVLEHSQAVPGAPHVGLLAGVAGPEQGAAIGWLLGQLGRVLAAHELVAIVDTGRIRVDDPMAVELAHEALVSLLVSRSDPGSVLHLRVAADASRDRGFDPELVVIGDRPYSPSEVARATGLGLVGWLPDDAVATSMLLPPGPSDAIARHGNNGRSRPAARRDHSATPERRRYRASRDALASIVDALAARLGLSGPSRPWRRGREPAAR